MKDKERKDRSRRTRRERVRRLRIRRLRVRRGRIRRGRTRRGTGGRIGRGRMGEEGEEKLSPSPASPPSKIVVNFVVLLSCSNSSQPPSRPRATTHYSLQVCLLQIF